MARQEIITWSGSEYPHRPKEKRWYVVAVFIAVLACATSIYFENTLFAIFIIVAMFAFVLLGSRAPRIIEFCINDHGIRANNSFYPYENLHSFWVRQEEHGYVLVLRTTKAIAPYIFLHIDDADPNDIRDVISEFLPETPHEKTLLESFEEYIGF